MTDLSPVAQPPSGLEMSAAGQTIFTIFVTVIWVVAIALAVRYWRRHHSTMPLLLLAAGTICIVWEPVVDVLGMCFFPRENQWVGIEIFGRPIPMFMYPVYSWFVGGQAILVWHLLQRGMNRRQLWQLWVTIMVVNVFLETPGLLMDVYVYYGSQPFNPWGLPLWWPPVNAGMPIVAGYLAYRTAPLLQGWKSLLVLALLPMADGVANAATAWPVWITLNTNLGMAATYPAALLTVGLGAVMIWVVSLGLPAPTSAPATETAHDGTAPPRRTPDLAPAGGH